MTHRALVIGIDRYANLPYPLEGCVNDAKVLGALLADRFGFLPDQIVTLLDEGATRDRILSELDRLVDAAAEDDIIVLTYSGHGSQMTDREGDEPDGLDETIVPHDSGRAPHPNRDISDDELYVRLVSLAEKTRYVTLIFDCCHSGSISRDAFGERSRWIEPDLRPVQELPPSVVPPELLADRPRDLGPSGWLPLAEHYVLIAGCRDDESSYEHTVTQGDGTVTHGALTYFLASELARSGPGTTYRDVFETASAEVTAAKPRQHPQMEGAADREVFGVREVEPMRYVSVSARVGTVVTLRAGLAHGVTVGSRWAVYPPGTKDITAAERLGLVAIASTGATGSDAEVVEEALPGSIVEGCRAAEESHDYGDLRLRVQVVAPDGWAAQVDRLLAPIDGSGLVRHAADDEPADVRAYLVPARDAAGEGDPVPQLGAVAEPLWAVVGADGLLMMPRHPVGAPGSEAIVLANLEEAARYRHVLSLRNPDPDAALLGKVDLRLLRLGPDGTWVDAEPDLAGGRVEYTEGERVAVEIVNRHSAAVYVSVLDLGLAGAIGLLYPAAGVSDQLAPGRSIRVGVRGGDELVLTFPEGFDAAPDPTDARRAEGTETFKLIATTSPADFGPLLQGGYRDALATRSPVQELVALALGAGGARDVAPRPVQVSAADAWVTVERGFSLRRETA